MMVGIEAGGLMVRGRSHLASQSDRSRSVQGSWLATPVAHLAFHSRKQRVPFHGCLDGCRILKSVAGVG